MRLYINSASGLALTTGTGTVSTGSLPAGSSSTKQYVTALNFPYNNAWPPQQYVFRLNITTAGASCYAKARIGRVSSGGTLIEATDYSAEVLVSTTGVKTLYIPAKEHTWSGGSYTDRLALEVIIRNGSAASRVVVYTYTGGACYFDADIVPKALVKNTDSPCGGSTTGTADLDAVSGNQHYTLEASTRSYKFDDTITANFYVYRNYTLIAEYTGHAEFVVDTKFCDVQFYKDISISCTTVAYSVSVAEATFGRVYVFVASVGSFTITWKDANFVLTRSYTLAAQVTAFQVTGSSSTFVLQRNYRLVADRGIFSLSGKSANFVLQRNYTLQASTGSYTLSGGGANFALQRNYSLVASRGIFTITGVSTGLLVLRNYRIISDKGTFYLSGNSVEITSIRVLPMGVGQFNLTGFQMSFDLQRNYTLVAGKGTFNLSGVSANLTRQYSGQFSPAAYLVNGISAEFNLQRNYTLQAGVGSFNLSGKSADLILLRNYALSVERGIFSLTGSSVVFTKTKSLQAGKATYTLSGVTAQFTKSLSLTAEKVEYSLSGKAAYFGKGYTLLAGTGVYNVQSTGANLFVLRNYNLIADSGVFSLSGLSTNFTLLRNYCIVVSKGIFVTSGSEVVAHRLVAQTGSFTVQSTGAGLLRGYKESLGTGSYQLSGVAANFVTLRNYKLSADTGGFGFTGIGADFITLRNYTLPAGSGIFTLTGQGANLHKALKFSAGGGTFILSGIATNFYRKLSIHLSTGVFTLDLKAAELSVLRNYTLGVQKGTFNVSENEAVLFVLRNYTLTATSVLYEVTGEQALLFVLRNPRIITETGVFSTTGNLIVSYRLSPQTGVFSLSSPGVNLPRELFIRLDNGVFTLGGVAIPFVLQRNYTLHCSRCEIVLNGYLASLELQRNYTLVAEWATFTLQVNDISWKRNYQLPVTLGVYNLNGVNTPLLSVRSIVAQRGQYLLSIQDAGLFVLRNYSLQAESASYTLTGNPCELRVLRNYTLTASSGAYNLVGYPVNLTVLRNYTLTTEQGTFVIATGVLSNYRLVAGVGSFSLQGWSVRLLRVVLERGIFNLQGNSVQFKKDFQEMLSESTLFTLWGASIDLLVLRNYTLPVSAGLFNVTTQEAELVVLRNYLLPADVGGYILAGSDAGLKASYRMSAQTGSYILSASDVEFTKKKSIVASLGQFFVDTKDASFITLRNYTLEAEVGVFTVTGGAATFILLRSYTLSAITVEYSVSGNSANLFVLRNPSLALEQGVFLIGTGEIKQYRVTLDSGTFNLTGFEVHLRRILVGTGEFILNGSEALFRRDFSEVNTEVGTFLVGSHEAGLIVLRNYILTASFGAYNLSGIPANVFVLRNPKIAPDTGIFVISGEDAVVTSKRSLIAQSGTFTLDGSGVDFRKTKSIEAVRVEYNLSGKEANLFVLRNPSVGTDVGQFILSLKDAGLIVLRNPKLSASTGYFVVTGIDAVLGKNYTLEVQVGQFNLTGVDCQLTSALTLTTSAGVYLLSGKPVNFDDTRVYRLEADCATYNVYVLGEAYLGKRLSVTSGVFEIFAQGIPLPLYLRTEAGSFILDCQPIGLQVYKRISALAQQYQVVGGNTKFVLNRGYSLSADTGSFSVTGIDCLPFPNFYAQIDTGIFTLNGLPVEFTVIRNHRLNVERGVFWVVPEPVLLYTRKNFTLSAETGSFVIDSGVSVLSRQYKLTAEAGGYAVNLCQVETGVSISISLNTAEYVLTGKQVTFDEVNHHRLEAGSGSFLISMDVATTVQYQISVDQASFYLSGKAVQFPRLTHLRTQVENYTLTGYDNINRVSRYFKGDGVLFKLSMFNAKLTRNRSFNVGRGIFSISGFGELARGVISKVTRGIFSLIGLPVSTPRGYSLTASTGVILVQASEINVGVGLSTVSGEFLVTGGYIEAKKGLRLQVDVGVFNVVTQNAEVEPGGINKLFARRGEFNVVLPVVLKHYRLKAEVVAFNLELGVVPTPMTTAEGNVYIYRVVEQRVTVSRGEEFNVWLCRTTIDCNVYLCREAKEEVVVTREAEGQVKMWKLTFLVNVSREVTRFVNLKFW